MSVSKLKILKMWWTDLFPQRWPTDPEERRRIQAYILGAGAGAAIRPSSDGKIHIVVEKSAQDVAKAK